jgi:hypothetical protein
MADDAPAALPAPQLREAHKEGVTTIAYVPGKGGCITAGARRAAAGRAHLRGQREARAGRARTPLAVDHKPPHPPPQARTSGSWRASWALMAPAPSSAARRARTRASTAWPSAPPASSWQPATTSTSRCGGSQPGGRLAPGSRQPRRQAAACPPFRSCRCALHRAAATSPHAAAAASPHPAPDPPPPPPLHHPLVARSCTRCQTWRSRAPRRSSRCPCAAWPTAATARCWPPPATTAWSRC